MCLASVEDGLYCAKERPQPQHADHRRNEHWRNFGKFPDNSHKRKRKYQETVSYQIMSAAVLLVVYDLTSRPHAAQITFPGPRRFHTQLKKILFFLLILKYIHKDPPITKSSNCYTFFRNTSIIGLLCLMKFSPRKME